MNSIHALSGAHRRTYETIFQHPISHNLEWRAVRALLEHLGQVTEEANGNLKATRNGQSLILHPPRTKDVTEASEVMTLRYFLEQSATVPPAVDGKDAHWLLVIDHQEARVFRSEDQGAVPWQILPPEPKAYFRHAYNSKEASRGKEKPDPNSFFKPVAEALHGAGQILIFGAGTGMSSEMDQFVKWSRIHHPDLAERIVGSQVVDESPLTDGQLLGQARDFYANARAT